ncbi:putative repeat protein (TIGR02543 family) [Leifsonia psychrotolerans]|uniref:Putative repeat protein (TIGR02543 family) n=1 Tax=Glaciibacter psychrotolerans TaxID=670054 RepID=A0A7Z0EFL2_9MICO|nr:putative repeat protein (TIGR02543 family) [Leifsonia psychrotolerans]
MNETGIVWPCPQSRIRNHATRLVAALVVVLLLCSGQLIAAEPASAAVCTQIEDPAYPNLCFYRSGGGAGILQGTTPPPQNGPLNLPDTAFVEGSQKDIIHVAGSGFVGLKYTTLKLPARLQLVGGHAFNGSGLMSVTMPNSVTQLQARSFANNRLTSVTLSESMSYLADSVFAGNPTLNDVTFTGPPPSTGDFSPAAANGSLGPNADITVYYPWRYEDKRYGGGFTVGKWRGYRSQAVARMTFNMNGHGTPPSVPDVVINQMSMVPSVPTSVGYTFTNWYSDVGLTSVFAFSSTPVTGDTTLYAKWTLNTHTITFDSNGGTTLTPATVDHNSTATKPADPTKTDHTFAGWFTDTEHTSPFAFSTTPITANTTLYAKWTLNTHTITFDSNGGTTLTPATVDHNSTATKPADPTKTDHTFAGWFTDTEHTSPFAFSTTPITANTTLYAKWTLNTHTITFDSNGGTTLTPATVDHNSTATKPADPTKTDHTFAGWFTDTEHTSPFAFSTTPITANTTLYAKWTLNTHTITFDSNGGTTLTPATVDHNSTATKPADPTKTDHTFAGWFTDTEHTSPFAFSTTPITANTTLYAKWTLNTHTITFDSNGGTTLTPATVDHNSTATKPADPTKTDHTFAGWFTDTEHTSPFAFSTTPITANTTLYAKWTLNTHTITFDSNGGTTLTPATVDHNSTATKPADPTKTDHTFAGWFTDTDLSTPFLFDSKIETDTTVYAGWTAVPPTPDAVVVKLVLGEHGSNTHIIIAIGELLRPPTAPIAIGFTFTGWFADAALTIPFDFSKPITAEATIYAGWQADAVTPKPPVTAPAPDGSGDGSDGTPGAGTGSQPGGSDQGNNPVLLGQSDKPGTASHLAGTGNSSAGAALAALATLTIGCMLMLVRRRIRRV